MAPPDKRTDRQTPIPASVGPAIRRHRLRKGLTAQALAEKASVSPSLISQVETGKLTPSVGTLFAIVVELGLSLDELFFESEEKPQADRVDSDESPPQVERVVRNGDRAQLDLGSGVHWQRLTPTHDRLDFLYVVYEVGGASCAEDTLMRHHGREFGLVLSGRLGAKIGFDFYELSPGDSIVFNADTPHRLWTIGDEPSTVVWSILGREDDGRDTKFRD